MFNPFKTLAVLLLAGGTLTSCEKEFQKPDPPADFRLFGGERNDAIRAITETPSGDLILVGSTQTSEEDYDVLILRTSTGGDLLDSASIHLDRASIAQAVIPYNGGYAVAGITGENEYPLQQTVFLLFLDENLTVTGTVTDAYQVGAGYTGRINGFYETPDGNLMLGIHFYTQTSLLKISPTGTLLNEASFVSGYSSQYGNQVAPADSGWVATTLTNTGGIQLRKYDNDLNLLWENLHDSQTYQQTGSILVHNNKIYTTHGSFGFSIRVQQFSLTGEAEMEMNSISGGTPWYVAPGDNGDLWVAGMQPANGNNYDTDAFVARVTPAGEIVEVQSQGGDREESVRAFFRTSGGLNRLAGSTDSFRRDGLDAFLWIL